MSRTRTIAIAAALVAVPLAASAQEKPQPGKPAGAAAVGVTKKSPYGEFLVDAKGRALYMFTADAGQEGSACYDACAKAWPPLLTKGDPRADAPDLDPTKLSTIERRDGTRQVTYAGMPLYYFVKDKRAGDIKGQDVTGHGGEWYLVSPGGAKIE